MKSVTGFRLLLRRRRWPSKEVCGLFSSVPYSTSTDLHGLQNSNANSFHRDQAASILDPHGSIPIPHKTIPEIKGQDLDFVNVAHSHLIHSDWDKLNSLSSHLTPLRVKHILLKLQKDPVLSLEFFNWVKSLNSNCHTLESHSMILHTLTKYRKFKSAESIFRSVIVPGSLYVGFPAKLLDALIYSYRLCDSSPRVFDSLFKTYAHLKKFRYATDAFCQMKSYGFWPTVESCNAYLSSLLDLGRVDIALGFYREMRRCRISPNVYSFNMAMDAFGKSGKLEKAVEVFREMEDTGVSHNVASYNVLIAGHCNKGLPSLALKLKNSMVKKGLQPNVITFNSLIHGYCKQGLVLEANKVLSEMKDMNVAPNTVTYNTLINCYSHKGNSEMGGRLHKEMLRNGVKPDIVTYNALILGLCKLGKTKKAAYLVKDLEKDKLAPNASTFAALITGQCIRKNSHSAFQLYKSMLRTGCHPNEQTFKMLLSSFCETEDFEGAFQVITEMFQRCINPSSDVLREIYSGLCRFGNDQLATKLRGEIEARKIMQEVLLMPETYLAQV